MRRVLIAFGILAAIVLAGCTSEPAFADDATYEEKWGAEETVAFQAGDDLDYGIVTVRNTTEIELWRRSSFGGDEPLQIDAVRFRHTNTTVTNVSSIDRGGSRTVVSLPAREGELGYVMRHRGGDFVHPMPVAGSARVELPPGTDARNLVLGGISPGDHEVVSEDPLVIRWDDLEQGTTVSVRYYDEGDPLLLIGLLAVLVVAAAGVLLYYRRIFDRLRRRTRQLEQ